MQSLPRLRERVADMQRQKSESAWHGGQQGSWKLGAGDEEQRQRSEYSVLSAQYSLLSAHSSCRFDDFVIFYCVLCTLCSSSLPAPCSPLPAPRSPSSHHRRRQLAGEPLAGDVQTPLDRADRRAELVAHLDQRAAVEVKRDQRLPVQGREPIQARVDLVAALRIEDVAQRRLLAGASDLERLRA